jgi:hypothetical protein
MSELLEERWNLLIPIGLITAKANLYVHVLAISKLEDFSLNKIKDRSYKKKFFFFKNKQKEEKGNVL